MWTLSRDLPARFLLKLKSKMTGDRLHFQFFFSGIVWMKNTGSGYRLVDPQLLWQCYDETHDQQHDRRMKNWGQFVNFTITAEIHVRSVAKFYRRYADRHMELKFMRRVSKREWEIRQFVIVKNKLTSVFYASVLLLTMNSVITLSKEFADPQLLWQCCD